VDDNKKIKPVEADERIKQILSGDAQKNALDFTAFLKANGIMFDYNADESEKKAVLNGAVCGVVGESIGYLSINGETECPGPWTFWFNSCDFAGSGDVDEAFKNAVWAFTSSCVRCANDNWEQCRGDGKRTILGKEFENQCHSPLMFCDPDAKTLAHMKTFLMYLKPEIDDIQSRVKS